jgi:hypothetical protein
MSDASEKFNALPIEQRKLLIPLMLENELRLIAMEQRRIREDYLRAIRAHKERANRIAQEIERLKAEESA